MAMKSFFLVDILQSQYTKESEWPLVKRAILPQGRRGKLAAGQVNLGQLSRTTTNYTACARRAP